MVTTLNQYRESIRINDFDEHPYFLIPGPTLESFVDYKLADLELKIYLTGLILFRNFAPAGGHEIFSDHLWIIRSFLEEYKEDEIKPWLTPTIREAIESVISDQVFTRNLLGSTFLFGVIEFYAKYILGYRPLETDEKNQVFQKTIKDLSIGQAIFRLKKMNIAIAKDINKIDRICSKRLQEVGIQANATNILPKIADRLNVSRNTMLHGEHYNFYSMGKYLSILYILFHLHIKLTKQDITL